MTPTPSIDSPASIDFAVSIDALVKSYRGRAVVDGLSLTAQRGEITTVLGPNGAGKTTSMEICEGYRGGPDSGEVRVLGLDPTRDGAKLKPRVGVMLQSDGVYPTARPLEVLRHRASLHAHPLPVGPLAERLGLSRHARTPYRRLSGGEQQRLKLALALIGRPELVFLDEPTAGLDPQARLAGWDLIRELRDDGVTVVLTTHLMEEAESLADQVVIIDGGRAVASGTVADLTAADQNSSLTFRATSGLDLSALTLGLPQGSLVVEEAPGRYRMTGEIDPATLASITAWSAGQGEMLTDLATSRRSLEDVFLDLTGREFRP